MICENLSLTCQLELASVSYPNLEAVMDPGEVVAVGNCQRLRRPDRANLKAAMFENKLIPDFLKSWIY